MLKPSIFCQDHLVHALVAYLLGGTPEIAEFFLFKGEEEMLSLIRICLSFCQTSAFWNILSIIPCGQIERVSAGFACLKSFASLG